MACFFQVSSSEELDEVEELLRRKYNGIEFLNDRNIIQAYDFILLAKRKEKEERYFIQWSNQLPWMDKDNYISFDDYVDRQTGKNIVTKSRAEILKEVEEINRMTRKEV